MKKEQEQVILTSFTLTKYKAIKAVQFTPDIMEQKLIKVTGEIGSSKSSVLEGLQIATSGAISIDKKDSLDSGFLAEVQLIDGEHKLFLGAKVRETKKGEKKFETFIYSKGADGKPYTPIIDGSKATAKDYMEILNTDITFRMADLFSENQTTHRKFIEKIFENELKSLGIDEVIDSIEEAKKNQDNKRAMADANGCFMATFNEEGWNEDTLAQLEKIDIDAIRSKISKKEIEKDRLVNSPATAFELAKTKAQKVKDDKLNEIKGKVSDIVERVRVINDKKNTEYTSALSLFEKDNLLRVGIEENTTNFISHINEYNFTYLSSDEKTIIEDMILYSRDRELKTMGEPIGKPTQPKIIPIEFGKLEIPTEYDAIYEPLLQERTNYAKEYTKIDSTPLELPVQGIVDTSKIDSELERLNSQVKGAEATNRLVTRFGHWKNWIEAKGLYEKEIDTLRKLYGKIKTGVEGLSIIPQYTNSGRVEIWMMYNGQYDPNFFQNKDNEDRHITGKQGYSASQKAIIGLLLQAARLDLKPKALRLAILDDVPLYTKAGVEMLAKVQSDKNLTLITTHTDSEYDKDNIEDGVIIMECGEAFFK